MGEWGSSIGIPRLMDVRTGALPVLRVLYFFSEQRITSAGVGRLRESRLSPGPPPPAWAGGTFIRSRGASCDPGMSVSPYVNTSLAVHVCDPSVTETRTV